MNDDLVQRLRDTGPGGGTGAGLSLCCEAADRIEALEAALRQISETPNCGWHCVASDVGRIAREALDA